jgi:hypothetical protein
MKRWQAILIQLGVAAGGIATTAYVKDDNTKNAALGLLGLLGAYVTKKASDSNPDGTSAKVAYIPEEKK